MARPIQLVNIKTGLQVPSFLEKEDSATHFLISVWSTYEVPEWFYCTT